MNIYLTIFLASVFAQNFKAPSADDHRGPCPGLNTLANHGIINRNGTNITTTDIKKVLLRLGADEVLSEFLAVTTIPDYARDPYGNIDLQLLSAHNVLEHDASLFYDDYFFTMKTTNFNQSYLDQLLELGKKFGRIGYEEITAFKKMRLNHSQEYNLNFQIPDYPMPIKSDFQFYHLTNLFCFFGNGLGTPTNIAVDDFRLFIEQNMLPQNFAFPERTVCDNANYHLITEQLKVLVEAAPSRKLRIPQKEPAGSVEQRAAAIKNAQTLVQTGPVVFENNDQRNFVIGTGPLISSPFVQKWIKTGVDNIIQRIEQSTSAARAGLGKLFFNPNPPDLSSLRKITAFVRDEVRKFMPLPENMKLWKDEYSFGEIQFGYGGYKLEVATECPLDESLLLEITGKTFKEINVFKAEYKLSKYSKGKPNMEAENPFGQYVPDTVTYLYKNSKEKFEAIAIHILDSGLIYTKLDGAENWQFAQLAASTGMALFYAAEHYSLTHALMLGVQSEMIRNLSSNHPVYALLNHHFKDNLAIVYLGFQAVIGPDGPTRTYTALGGAGVASFMQDRFENYDFEYEKLSNRLKRSGITEEILDCFPFRDDYLALRVALDRFVLNYLELYYRENTDVAQDFELQNWAAGVSAPESGNIKGFPSKFDSISQLADTVAEIISWITIMHGYMNGDSRWLAQSYPMAPKALYGALPKSKSDPLPQYLVPTAELVGLEMVQGAAFFIPTHYKDNGLVKALAPYTFMGTNCVSSSLGYSYGQELGDAPKRAIKLFISELESISAKVVVKNKFFSGLEPTNIKSTAWV